MATMTYEPLAGEDIRHSCRKAQAMATRTGRDVQFSHNGVDLTATADTTAESLYEQWDAGMKANSSAYWTPERKAEEARRTAREVQRMEQHMASLSALNWESPEAVCDWLCEYEHRKFIHTPVDTQSLVAKFGALSQDGPPITTVYEWTGAANDHDMQNPLNWTPNGVPRTPDEVRCMVIPRPAGCDYMSVPTLSDLQLAERIVTARFPGRGYDPLLCDAIAAAIRDCRDAEHEVLEKIVAELDGYRYHEPIPRIERIVRERLAVLTGKPTEECR